MHKMNNFLKFLLSLIATSGFLLSCGIKELEKPQNENKIINIPIPNETALCITAVEYPKDYNWQNDDKYGTVKCSIMVESEGRILARIPVGHEYEISSDPDMHRFIANALYTDYSSDTHTIIKRNGEELFRYEGQEMIINMAVFEDEVHTIGKNREGPGYTYRINGKKLLEWNGNLFSHISIDGNAFTFCYSRTNETQQTTYYCYNKGQHHEFFPHKTLDILADAGYNNGKIVYIGTTKNQDCIVVVNGPKIEKIDAEGLVHFFGLSIIGFQDDTIYFSGRLMGSLGGPILAFVCKNNVFIKSWETEDYVSSCSTVKNNIIYGLLPNQMVVFEGEQEYQLPQEYRNLCNPPIFLNKNNIYVGLSSRKDGYPILWTKDGTREIKINGFISSISIIEKDYNVEKDYNESSQDTVLE